MSSQDIKEQIAAQNIIQQINSNPTPPSPSPTPTGVKCPQCGIIHPPVKPGEICPMAPIKTKDNKVVDPNNFLSKMKLIITSQIEQNGVEDTDKFFQYLTVELTKAMENYKE